MLETLQGKCKRMCSTHKCSSCGITAKKLQPCVISMIACGFGILELPIDGEMLNQQLKVVNDWISENLPNYGEDAT